MYAKANPVGVLSAVSEVLALYLIFDLTAVVK